MSDPVIQKLSLSDCLSMRHRRNPKDHKIEDIIKSFRRFGFVAFPTIDEASQTMIAGHGRCEALAKMRADGAAVPSGIGIGNDGEWMVPVIRGLSWKSETERDAYVIADNQLAIAGGWKFQELGDLLAEIANASDDDSGLDGLGFDPQEIDALLEDDEGREVAVDGHVRVIGGGADPGAGYKPPEDDEVPEPPKDPITKPGDIWTLGDSVLFCGDSRGDIAHLFGDAKAAIAVTSPPYASQRKYDETTGFKPIPPDEYVEWFDAVQRNVRAHLASDGSWFLNIKPHCDDGQRHLYVNDLVAAHVRRWGWEFVDELCWRNTKNGVPGGFNNRFKNAWEPVFHFSGSERIKFRPEAVSSLSMSSFRYDPGNSSGTQEHGPLRTKVSSAEEGMARPSNVIEASAESAQGKHSAPFPIALPAFFISAFTDEGDLVYEPFCGSGTTIIAATKLQRRCVGVEISPAYCDVIVERWERATGGKATRRDA